MKINTISSHRPSFGVRIQGNGLSKLKKICIESGLSPNLYKKEMAKIQKIFPDNKDLLILNFVPANPKDPFTTYHDFFIATSYKRSRFDVPKNPKYAVASFISACKELAQKS